MEHRKRRSFENPKNRVIKKRRLTEPDRRQTSILNFTIKIEVEDKGIEVLNEQNKENHNDEAALQQFHQLPTHSFDHSRAVDIPVQGVKVPIQKYTLIAASPAELANEIDKTLVTNIAKKQSLVDRDYDYLNDDDSDQYKDSRGSHNESSLCEIVLEKTLGGDDRNLFERKLLEQNGFIRSSVPELEWKKVDDSLIKILEKRVLNIQISGEPYLQKLFGNAQNAEFSPEPSSSNGLEPQGNGQWIVEKVIARRNIFDPVINRRVIDHLLKWKDWPYKDSSWENFGPEDNYEDLIKEFSVRHRIKNHIEFLIRKEKSFTSNKLIPPTLRLQQPAFSSCHEWEDKLNAVASKRRQGHIYVENWVDNATEPKKFTFILTNELSDETWKSLVPLPIKQDLHCECCENECGMKLDCCPDNFGMNSAYDHEGQVKPGFKFRNDWIIECTEGCACNINCPNRVVQRGREIPIVIFRTTDRGWSIRTAKSITKNRFVMEYVGVVKTVKEAENGSEQHSKAKSTYQYQMDGNGKFAFVVDAMHSGNEARFVNHSCNPNLIVRAVFADRYDYRYHRLAFFAKKDIYKGEELTIDYCADADGGKSKTSKTNARKQSCSCHSKNCRGHFF